MGCCAQCLQVGEGAVAVGCCNMRCPRNRVLSELLPAPGILPERGMGETFGNLIDKICTCSLLWGANDCPCRWFCSHWREYLWKGNRRAPRKQPQGGLVELEGSGRIGEGRVCQVKCLHMCGNWEQALRSSETRLKKKKRMLWRG